MRSVVHLFFFRYQLMPGRHGDVDTYPKLVAFFVRMIWLLDRHIAPADVITKLVQTRCFIAHHLFDSIALVEAAISDVHWQLHVEDILRAVVMPVQGHLTCAEQYAGRKR